MATFTASWVQIMPRAGTVVSSGQMMPLADLSSAVRLTNLTTSGTSGIVQSGGGDWTVPTGGGVLMIACTGNVIVTAGLAPTASATTGVYVPAGAQFAFTVAPGHKVAVIDA